MPFGETNQTYLFLIVVVRPASPPSLSMPLFLSFLTVLLVVVLLLLLFVVVVVRLLRIVAPALHPGAPPESDPSAPLTPLPQTDPSF